MDTMPRKPFQDRFNSLQQEAQSWKPAWTDIQTYIAPTRGFFEGDQPNRGKMIDHKRVVNGHATRALDTLASGMTSGLTSPSRPWFKLGLPDADLTDFAPVKEWLGQVQMLMMGVYAKSNIYGVLNSIYAECGGFGTGAIIILPDYQDVIRGSCFTTGEYFLGTGADNRVNAFARKFFMTCGQLVEEFGIDNVSETIRNRYKESATNNVDQWVPLIHLIERNTKLAGSYDVSFKSGQLRTFKNKPYRSVYWEQASPADTFLRLSGFEEFPIMAPRWNTTTTADIYGRSPGWSALGDVKMLQKMEINKLKALDKVVDPPMQADSSIEEVNTLPGGVTRYSASVQNAGVKALYELRPDFQAIEMSISKTEDRINRAFYADLFMMIAQADRPNMTAREIVERHEEKLLMLGPVLERLESELLDPMIDRTFKIMLRSGMIPPPPEELEGKDLNVEYISMLAQAQKMVGTAAIEQVARFTGSLAGAYPDVLDNFDADAAVNEYAEMTGVPPRIMRSMEEVGQMRTQKQQQAQNEQAAAAIPSAVEGAKVLADTKLGQNSALDQILAGITGNGAPPVAANGVA